MLGVEISELLRPASSNFGIVPAEAESYYKEIVATAQEQCYSAADAIPVTINLYFANSRGERRGHCPAILLKGWLRVLRVRARQIVSSPAGAQRQCTHLVCERKTGDRLELLPRAAHNSLPD
jgi:hypothetical protein